MSDEAPPTAPDEAPPAAPDEAPPTAPVPAGLRRAILALVAVTTVASMLGSAFLPYLASEAPILLLVTGSDARNLVLASPRVDLPILLLVAVPRRALGMVATYGLGLLFGRAALAWSGTRFPRLSRFFGRVVALFGRFERASLVFWPTYTTSGLAGVRAMAWGRYVAFMLVGQTVYVLTWTKVGTALSAWTDRAIRAVSPYLVETTVVSVVLVGGYQGLAYWRRRRGGEGGDGAGGGKKYVGDER